MGHWRTRAFTLVEVMVALAIIALSLTAIAAKMSRMIDTSLRSKLQRLELAMKGAG